MVTLSHGPDIEDRLGRQIDNKTFLSVQRTIYWKDYILSQLLKAMGGK